MTVNIKEMHRFIRNQNHHKYRKTAKYTSAEKFQSENIHPMERVSISLREVLAQETPVVFKNEKILFWRTVSNLPDILTDDEWNTVREKYFVHELGRVSNLSPDYGSIIKSGLLPTLKYSNEKAEAVSDSEQKMFYNSVSDSIDTILELTERYRIAAIEAGNIEAASVLERVPAYGARTFREALQSLRILHYGLWCEGNYHNTLGRFDQYMFPYLEADLSEGRISEDEAFELLEEFFLSLNKDSDLYPGIQQGDNGQSMMLGGVDKDGNSCFNKLSEMCLDASRELKLIDPKINLRVEKNTPLWVYEKGSLLTKEGLGFPQYSNDDVVIPGLVQKGYELADARDYTVAACWEFIIPGVGADIPNISAINFPSLVSDTIINDIEESSDYDDFFSRFKNRLNKTCEDICSSIKEVYFVPAPYLSIFMSGCVENGKDISMGNKYNNFGFHGVGLSTAIDSLYSVKKLVFDRKKITAAEAKSLIQNLDESPLLPYLRYDLEKFGNNDDEVDTIAVKVLDAYADVVEPLENSKGGCVRAGTGSAMFYLWYAENVGNALSGHQKGEAFSANYAPELFVRNNGPLSVIRSFTKPNLKRVINGGPLTMEFHSSIFRNEESIKKVASLVQAFINNGGHQLQLNSVNRDTLLDAQKHPEEYKSLIVRIWGWSAYFTELDKEYQDHVISRQEYLV